MQERRFNQHTRPMKPRNEEAQRKQVWGGCLQPPLDSGFCRALLLAEMWLDSVICLKFLIQTVMPRGQCVVLSMGYLLPTFVPMSYRSELKSAVSLVKYGRVSGEQSCSATTNIGLTTDIYAFYHFKVICLSRLMF